MLKYGFQRQQGVDRNGDSSAIVDSYHDWPGATASKHNRYEGRRLVDFRVRLQLVSGIEFALPVVKRGGGATHGLAELLDRLVALLELFEAILPKLKLSLTSSSRH